MSVHRFPDGAGSPTGGPPHNGGMEERLSTVEQAVVRIDERLDSMDGRFDGIDVRLDGIDVRLDGIDGRLDSMDGRLSRVEVKLEHVDGEVSNLKWWLAGATLTIVLSTVATVVGTGIGIQQMTVATFQAAGAQQAAGTQSQPAQPPAIIINVPAAPAPTAASR